MKQMSLWITEQVRHDDNRASSPMQTDWINFKYIVTCLIDTQVSMRFMMVWCGLKRQISWSGLKPLDLNLCLCLRYICEYSRSRLNSDTQSPYKQILLQSHSFKMWRIINTLEPNVLEYSRAAQWMNMNIGYQTVTNTPTKWANRMALRCIRGTAHRVIMWWLGARFP